ncbi:phage major capsid protein [Pseudoclavibacter helvolus]|uniref:phage major capsid protein n=1 Tax=Pseudoclavibacter helvolus TaxID=255205 RepID=UPI003C778B2A
MAQTAPTTTSQFAGFIKPTEAGAIFDEARKSSVVQQLVRQIPIGANGVEVAYTTAKPKAAWVAEGAQKPTTEGGKAIRKIAPKKLAAISVVSAETVRANPGGYIDDLKLDLAEAFAVAFDAAALHGTDTPFGAGNFIAATTKSVELGTALAEAGGLHADLNAGLALLVNAGKRLTGFAFDSTAEPLFNGAVDKNGRPLFIDSPIEDAAAIVRGGRVLGRQAFLGDGVGKDPVVGFGGNWAKAAWGVVGGITYDVSTHATVTIGGELVSLFEHNLVAIRAEAEYGWDVSDTASFVKYANATV